MGDMHDNVGNDDNVEELEALYKVSVSEYLEGKPDEAMVEDGAHMYEPIIVTLRRGEGFELGIVLAGTRIVQSIAPGSAVDCWNKLQTTTAQQILPSDHILKINDVNTVVGMNAVAQESFLFRITVRRPWPTPTVKVPISIAEGLPVAGIAASSSSTSRYFPHSTEVYYHLPEAKPKAKPKAKGRDCNKISRRWVVKTTPVV